MDAKIIVFSDDILSGDYLINFKIISKKLLKFGININKIIVQNQNEKFDDFSSPTFLFLSDENIEDFIQKTDFFHRNQGDIIEQKGIIYGEKYPIAVFPLEDIDKKTFDIFLESIKKRFLLPTKKIFKLFGVSKEDACKKLDNLALSSIYQLKGKFPFLEIYIDCQNSVDFIQEDEIQITDAFGENIYAQNEMSLSETLVKVMQLSSKKLYLNDCFTKGLLSRQILKFADKNQFYCKNFDVTFDSGYVKCELLPDICNSERDFLNKMADLDLKDKNEISITVIGRKINNAYRVCYSICNMKKRDYYNLTIEGSENETIDLVNSSIMLNLIKKLREKDFAF